MEFDASRRATQWLERTGLTIGQESAMSKDALHWAAMTYVVAALGSLVMLGYYVLQFMGMSDD